MSLGLLHPSKCCFQTSLIPSVTSPPGFLFGTSSSLFGGLLGEHFLLARKFLKYYESKSHQCFQQFHEVYLHWT